ncbi:hypothetical protein L7F22_036250 [Adiantum nelumboides]|nr:hypothetical protein [Adiantum nelumboides]
MVKSTALFEVNRPVSWFHQRMKSLFPIEVSLGQFGLEDTGGYRSDIGFAVMADRPDDVTEEVSSSQGRQTHEVGESSRPPQTEEEIFRTQLVTAVTMFTQVMQNPRFMALLQSPLPSQPVGTQKQRSESVKAQAQVIHTVESMETPVHLLETMQFPKPVPNAQEQVAETPVFQAVPVEPATFQQPIMGREATSRLCNKSSDLTETRLTCLCIYTRDQTQCKRETPVEFYETVCWGCGLSIECAFVHPVFMCSWCGAVSNHNKQVKNQGRCLNCYHVLDRVLVTMIISIVILVIGGGVWAVFPIVCPELGFMFFFHTLLTGILSFNTLFNYCVAAFVQADLYQTSLGEMLGV